MHPAQGQCRVRLCHGGRAGSPCAGRDQQATSPSSPRLAAYDYEYRNGVSNLFMLFAPLEGWRLTDQRTKASLGPGGGWTTRTKPDSLGDGQSDSRCTRPSACRGETHSGEAGPSTALARCQHRRIPVRLAGRWDQRNRARFAFHPGRTIVLMDTRLSREKLTIVRILKELVAACCHQSPRPPAAPRASGVTRAAWVSCYIRPSGYRAGRPACGSRPTPPAAAGRGGAGSRCSPGPVPSP